MKRYAILALAAAGSLGAQTMPPHAAEGKAIWTNIKNNLSRMLDAMPEENYGFKPTADIRSFGELAAHVADAQGNICGAASGKTKPAAAAGKTAKADLVAAMKESISFCDAAWDSITEANAAEKVGNGPGARSRLASLEYNSVHSNEEYGYMAVYMRLKGVVPPSSAPKK